MLGLGPFTMPRPVHVAPNSLCTPAASVACVPLPHLSPMYPCRVCCLQLQVVVASQSGKPLSKNVVATNFANSFELDELTWDLVREPAGSSTAPRQAGGPQVCAYQVLSYRYLLP